MRILILNILSLCMALSVLSCTKEEPAAVPQGGAPCPVTFRLETEPVSGIAPVSDAAARATDNAIRDINFHIYDQEGDLIRFGYTSSAFVPTMTLAPGTYRVYVVANAGSAFGQLGEAALLALATPVTEHDDFIRNGTMYLSGMQTLTVAGSTTCRIVLRRAAAKIHMVVQFGKQMEGACIVHVVPGNAPACGRPFADNRLTASDPQLEFPYNDLTHLNLPGQNLVYYQYENLAGTNPLVTDFRERTDEMAPEQASYVSIRVLWDGAYFDYKVFLGGSGDAADFNVRRNTVYNYEVFIDGVSTDDLRIATTEYIFWVGRDYSIGGQRYRDGFSWNARVAYTQLEVWTDNCDPDQEYTVSFRPLSGTFHSDWTMEYMIASMPPGQKQYLPLVPGERVAIHKSNGEAEVIFAFSNLEGTKNYNTTDNYFEFTVCDSRGWGRTVVLSTNMDEWFK